MIEYKDLTYLTWDTCAATSQGTGGSYYKSHEKIIDSSGISKRFYYKISNYDSFTNTVCGYESFFEIIASRLGKMLGFNVLYYDLLNADIILNDKRLNTFVTRSESFRPPLAHKLTFETLCEQELSNYNDMFELINSFGFKKNVEEMFIFDFLIANRDRHGANIEIIDAYNQITLSKLFDNGLSFIAPFGTNFKSIYSFEPLTDVITTNYIGSKSLRTNLNLITEPVICNRLPSNWKEILMYNLSDILPDVVISKVFEIIERRFEYVCSKNLLNFR